jgi:hypothetical protein
LFWNYREVEDGGDFAGECEVFRLRRHFLGDDRYAWRALRSRVRLSRDNGYMQDQQYAEEDIVFPKGRAMSVDLKFRDGDLRSIALDGVELPKVAEPLPAPAAPAPGQSGPIRWGGFSELGALYFSLPEIQSD